MMSAKLFSNGKKKNVFVFLGRVGTRSVCIGQVDKEHHQWNEQQCQKRGLAKHRGQHNGANSAGPRNEYAAKAHHIVGLVRRSTARHGTGGLCRNVLIWLGVAVVRAGEAVPEL